MATLLKSHLLPQESQVGRTQETTQHPTQIEESLSKDSRNICMASTGG